MEKANPEFNGVPIMYGENLSIIDHNCVAQYEHKLTRRYSFYHEKECETKTQSKYVLEYLVAIWKVKSKK